MRKSNFILLVISCYLIILLILPINESLILLNPRKSNFAIIFHIFMLLGLFIIGLYFKFEEKGISTKEMSFIAIYSTFTAVSRIPFLALPSIQPCTYLIFSAGFVFGPLIGFMVGMNTVILSNFLAGHGPWTLYQIIGWGLVGIIGGFFKNQQKLLQQKWFRIFIGFIGALLGLIYGMILNVWSWLVLQPPLTWQKFLFILTGSIIFDIAHAVANFIFLYFFGKETINILTRYHNRFLFGKNPLEYNEI